MIGWFGIRGIGSLYYLAYAHNHSTVPAAAQLAGITFSVITLSIVVHGSSATPLLTFYRRRRAIFMSGRSPAHLPFFPRPLTCFC